MSKSTIRYSLYASAVVFILTLTGIFGRFETRDVILDFLRLDAVFLILMLAGTAYIVANRVSENQLVSKVTNSLIASLVVAIVLIFMLLLEKLVNDPDGIIFVFQNYKLLEGSAVTFGYAGSELVFPGVFLLLLFSIIIGGLVGLLLHASPRIQRILVLMLGLVVIIGLLENQINDIIALVDALMILLAIVLGYIVQLFIRSDNPPIRIVIGFALGAALGVILSLLVNADALPDFGGEASYLTTVDNNSLLIFLVIFGVIGAVGALASLASRLIHNSIWYFLATLLILGVLNAQEAMTLTTAVVTGVIIVLALSFVPDLGKRSQIVFNQLSQSGRLRINRTSALIAFVIILIAPVFLGQYITNVLDLVALFVIMGIGLNVMVGYAGLLDLGYVASFAIGAYTVGLLTTPSIITTGCIPIEQVVDYNYFEMCTGVATNWGGIGLLSWWGALPLGILVSALTGMALGVPVLGLRGDYLAIVTLGFGQITAILTRSNDLKPILGSAQGIKPIPIPELDLSWLNPDWVFRFSDATSIYYLYVFAVLIAAFIVIRLAGSRLGRAWRAIKADEDVAEAMGVHLIYNKLLAFGISSAFAGLGGAIFAAALRGIFPDSFTILVSINVLSLIIIGGLGSIPGVIVGALMLVGLPEVLRELQDYRLLAFGSLLVLAMLLKPEGLLPPHSRQLSQMLPKRKTAEE